MQLRPCLWIHQRRWVPRVQRVDRSLHVLHLLFLQEGLLLFDDLAQIGRLLADLLGPHLLTVRRLILQTRGLLIDDQLPSAQSLLQLPLGALSPLVALDLHVDVVEGGVM